MSGKTAKLDIGGKALDLPVRSGSVGPDVIDITSLYKGAGAFTYDPGFTSTARSESKSPYHECA